MAAHYFYQLLGHVYLASHTADHHGEVASALKGAGFGADKIKKGLELSARGEELLERKMLESPDNKTLEHNIHSAVAEVEMWVQTVKLRLRKAGFDADSIKLAIGHELHAHRHTVTGIVQTLRAIGYLRTLDDEQRAALGSEQSVRDLVTRGNTLVKKLYKVADAFASPSSFMPGDAAIYGDLDKLARDLSSWISALDAAAQKCSDEAALGLAGYLPFGKGLPVGGNSFSVVLHERAIQDAPDPREAALTSGWSVGRQGNNENLGEGWIDPEFGSVMGD